MAFFLRFERDGEDLYPALERVIEEGRVPADNQVRYEVMRHFGRFVTESSEHFAEYVPWFIKARRPELIERFNIPLDEYPRRCERQIAEWEGLRDQLEARSRRSAPTSTAPTSSARARRAGRSPFYGNVRNTQDGFRLIDNLPPDCCVEVPLRGLRPRDRAAAGRPLAPPPGGADADQHQRPGADGRGRPDRAARAGLPRGDARSAHRGRAAARTRSAGWSTSCSRPTATSSRRCPGEAITAR
jgi:hypothetical protein